MEKIRVRFTAEDDWISRLIRLFTWSEYSHIDFVTQSGKMIGCWPGQGVSFHDKVAGKVQYAEIECYSAANVERFIIDQMGKQYDWGAIFGIVFRRKSWHNIDKWFCSELIAEALLQDGNNIINKHTYRVTPQDIIESPKVKFCN